MNLAFPTPPRDWLDGLDTSFGAEPERTPVEDIQSQAHIVNGGTAEFKCPSCKGSGRFVSYTGRVVGNCFKCKGAGNISKGQAAAIKGKATKEANKLAWAEEHAAEIAYINKRVEKGSNYYYGFKVRLDAHGSLFESTIEKIRADMAKDAEFYAAKKAEREAARPTVNMTAIEALFARAVNNDVKAPVFRGAEVTLKQAPAHGKNPGALYVTQTVPGKSVSGEYLGKIVNGKFAAFGQNGADTHAKLMLVAENPDAEAIRYASKFSACGICGTAVVNPVSIRSVIGPICARKFGLQHLRDMAEEDLNKEKAEEEAARKRGEII